MPAAIRAQLAQQIVNTLKTICSHDINYIDIYGRISASTDPDRVGSYHMGGHEAARTGQIIAIEEDDPQRDMRHGINMPIRFHGSTVAVIGITGVPEEVEKYANLAQRITLLLLREHEIDSRNYDTRTQTGYLVRALIDRENVTQDFIAEVLRRNGISDSVNRWRAVVIQLQESHIHPLAAIEAAVQELVRQLSCWSGTATVPAGSRICAGWRTDGPEISGSGSVPPDGCPARICPFRTPDWPSRAWTPGRTLPCTNPCGWRSCWGVFRKRLRTPICKNVWTDWMKPTESCCDFILPAKCP